MKKGNNKNNPESQNKHPDSDDDFVHADLAGYAMMSDQNDSNWASDPSMQDNNNIDQMKTKMMAMENKCALLEQKMENVKLQREMDNMQIEQLKREQQLEKTAYENKCALLEEKLKNMKLEWMIEREQDKKQIGELKRELLATQGKMEENAKKNNCALLELEHKLEMLSRKMVDNEQKDNEHFEQLSAASQKKLELEAVNEHVEQLKKENVECQTKLVKANKRAEEGKIAHQQWLLCNPTENKWDATKTRATISDGNGLFATHNGGKFSARTVTAILPFSFAVDEQTDHGIKINYYEVKTRCDIDVGLCAGKNRPQDGWVGKWADSWSIETDDINSYCSSDEWKEFEWPAGATKPRIKEGKEKSNVVGCGLVVCPNGKRSIFFTANGKLLGKHIPILTDVPLYPAVTLWDSDESVEANFGDNPAIPFVYDVTKCPGLDVVGSE